MLETIGVIKISTAEDVPVMLKVTASGGKYFIDGVQSPNLQLVSGKTYQFDLSDSSVATHPMQFKLDGQLWTDDINITGTLARDQIVTLTVPSASAGILSYFCVNHIGMGNNVNIVANTINGTTASDKLVGLQGDDIISSGQGDDVISGLNGNDQIDGARGIDTALYSGPQSSYTLVLEPGATTITDRRPGLDGTDTLSNMEFLDFTADALNAPFDLTQFGGMTGLSPQAFESFIELYIAYFNRAPDAIGLNFWGTAFANGTSLDEMAALFGPQEETLAAYPIGTSNEVFATTVYNNVLGRTPDQAGIDFWVGQLGSGNVSRDQFILEVLRGTKSDLKPEEGQSFVNQQIADRAYLENKIDIGAYFAVHRGMSNVDNASDAMALYNGSQDSIAQSAAAIDVQYQAALGPLNGEFLMQVIGVLETPFVA